MHSSFFLTVFAAAISSFTIFRKFRLHQENKETDSSISPSSPPSSLFPSSGPQYSSSHHWTHEVFPSFQGGDVRRDFLSHIHKEFQRKGVTTFIDNEIKRGESIGPELVRAIGVSKIAIILLSRNYPSSKWCLEELVEIMKCREELGQTVVAIFYKVDPSDVRNLTGYFGKVFRKTCSCNTKEDIKRWKEALEKVATIAGYHSNNWDNEAAMIEKIAVDVSNDLLNYAPSSDFDNLVGMRAHMETIKPVLHLDSDEVRMVGILGPSGIGKSTIARVLFSKYSRKFQLSAFMENIKRRYPRPCYDEYSAKLQLQKEFLSQIINQEDIKIHHLGAAQNRLKDKKVLVVLDDVDQSAQLDAVAKEPQWFGPGSRIVITTQDKRLLNAHRINHIYTVDFPSNDGALQIFCIYAFGQKSPYNGFENLAREVTQLAGELPLGLKVMGSYFKGMPKHEWTKALPRLRTSLDGEIESILKFSYDTLCDEDKDLFLYIACFFNYERVDKVEEHLAQHFMDVRQGLHVLAEKSLISVISWGYIRMHNLLARFGREIVRKQSISEPGQRRFLVDAGDVCKAINSDILGCRSVIGIAFKYSEIEDELNRSDKAFGGMSSLQFLRVRGSYNPSRSYLPQGPDYLPPKVRLLHWSGFPLTCLPSNFNLEFLVELNMPFSNLEKLWEGDQVIKNLKWVHLNFSKKLKELPDLSTATNLKKLNISGCSNLLELPSSIGNATSLEELDLTCCSNLLKLPSSIGDAKKLRELHLKDCTSLVELPDSIRNAANLKHFTFSGCTSLVKLPSFIGNATDLKVLDLEGCSSLLELPSSIGNITSLQYLYLNGCASLVELPSSIRNITMLKELHLNQCSSLVKLPSSIGNLHELTRLYLKGCSKLKALPININMKSLDELDLTDCSLLKSFPEISTNIRVLMLNGTTIEEIPSSIRSWSRLDRLHMSNCQNLWEFPHAFAASLSCS